MRTRYLTRLQERLKVFFRATCQRLSHDQFVMGDMRYNYQCHLNAAHCAAIDPTLRVALVYCVDSDDFGFLHVVNQRPDGTYIDNTLGFDYLNHHYYLIKMVPVDAYMRIAHWFGDIRKDFIRLHASERLCRWLNIEPKDVF